MTLRAALYARYSTDNQADRSVEDQFSLCESFAAAQGFSIAERYADRAISGQVFKDRLGMQRLLRDAKARAFDALIVENADRLARHPGDLHLIRESFAFLRIPVLQVHGGEFNAMQAAVSALVSTLTLDSLKDKIRRGMAGRAAQGLRMGGRLYGYRPVKGEPGHVTIDDSEAAIVRRIFALYVDGYTPRAIAGRLNAEGIPAPRGGRWNASSIGGWGQRGNGIIGNSMYVGIAAWNKVQMLRDPDSRRRVSRANDTASRITCERPDLAIIDRATWDKARARKGSNRNRMTGHRRKFLLSGLLRCPQCGGGMAVKDYCAGRVRVRCSTYTESRSCSSAACYYMDRIESAVIAGLTAHLTSDEGLRLYAAEYNAERHRLAKARARDRKAMEQDLARTDAELARAAQAIIAGVIAPATMAPHIRALEAKKRALESDLAEAAETPALTLNTHTAARFRAQLAGFAGTMAAAAREHDDETVIAFRQLVRRVTVMPDYALHLDGDISPLFSGGYAGSGRGIQALPPMPFTLSLAG